MKARLPDPGTGQFVFVDPAASIEGRTTESELLALFGSERLSVFVINGRFRCHKLADLVQIEGKPLILIFCFEDEVLKSISASIAGASGRGWAEWSQEAELRHLETLERLLVSAYGDGPCAFQWGVVSANYDARGGQSSLTISYAR